MVSPAFESRLRESHVRTSQVLALVGRYLPQAKHSLGEHTDWNTAGPALIARATRSLQAIATLQNGLFNADAAVVLRTMFEHVVTFAWLAADPPAHLPLWVKFDRQQRISADNDARAEGDPLLADEERAGFQQEINGCAGTFPGLPARAHAADVHWSALLEQHPGPRSRYSFRGMYRVLYRHASALTHVTPYGLHAFIAGDRPNLIIGGELVPEEFNSFTLAPAVLGSGLVISGHALGWPSMEELDDAFTVRA